MCTDIIYNKKNPIKKIMLTLNESHAAVVNDVTSDGFYARLDALHCQTVCVSSRFVWKLDKSLKSRTFTFCLFPHLRDFIACIVQVDESTHFHILQSCDPPAPPTKKFTAKRFQFLGIITKEYLDQIRPEKQRVRMIGIFELFEF